ncbi:MAG: hypothetical protein KDB05_31670, partial [Planctomycetales bacterium]|nr:hypothetical protein [Planctomycetales bacterium]
MPQLPDPSDIRTRPASVALGELAIAAGVVGESVTITSGFAANTLCQIWKYYTESIGAGNVIHVRSKRDLKDFAQCITSVRAVFVYAPRFYQDVAWQIQMAVSGTMSPRPAVFCGFEHDDPDLDPGITLPLTNEERETTAVHNWVAGQAERRVVEIEYPASIEYDARLETVLQPSSLDRIGLDFREQRIVEALIEGAVLLRSAANQDRNDLVATLADYEFVRRLLCSPVVRPNREFCDPLAADMMSRANVYLSVKLGGDRRNPFRVEDEDGYRRS